MPDVAVHAAVGQRILEQTDRKVKNVLCDEPYRFALFGPDNWFMYKPWQKRRNARGRRMHTTRTGLFLMTLADRCRESDSPEELFSYLSGFLCHYALDSTLHPYVYRMTETKYTQEGAHRALEHSMDVCELMRMGLWGEKHPITDHLFPVLHLPGKMTEDLDTVYGKVYGWKHIRGNLNRCCRMYRWLYRIMEKPDGLAVWLAQKTRKPFWQSFAYAESYLAKEDVENISHDSWQHSHDAETVYTKSVPDMIREATELATGMIEAAYRYVFEHTLCREDLEQIIGNRSYLSGLPIDDKRNWELPAALPSEE